MAFKYFLLHVHREQRMPPVNFGFRIAAYKDFFGPKTQVSGAGFVRKVKSQEQHAWNEPLFASPRVGLRSRHCAKRQLSGIGILEMSYLRAEFVPNSMS